MDFSENREKIINSYLSVASKANFTHFTSKKKEEIIAESINIITPNALTLMCIWVNSYNQISSTKRSTAKLMKRPKTVNVMFNNIYDLSTALRKAKHQYNVSSISTLGNYAHSSQSTISNLVQQGDNDVDNDGEKEGEGKENDDEEEDEEEDNDDEGNEEDNKKDKPEKKKNSAHSEIDFYSNLLKAKAKQRILSGNVPARINIPMSNNGTSLSHILLRQTEELLYERDLNTDKLELLKLCLLRAVNLLSPEHTTFYRKVIPNTMYKEIMKECDRQKEQFECTEIFDDIDELFDGLLQFQFDKNSKRILSYLDEKKFLEKDKDSEQYKLLRIVESVIHDFKAWMKEEDLAEGPYVRKFANILDILLEDEDVTAYDGETFSTATKFM